MNTAPTAVLAHAIAAAYRRGVAIEEREVRHLQLRLFPKGSAGWIFARMAAPKRWYNMEHAGASYCLKIEQPELEAALEKPASVLLTGYRGRLICAWDSWSDFVKEGK